MFISTGEGKLLMSNMYSLKEKNILNESHE